MAALFVLCGAGSAVVAVDPGVRQIARMQVAVGALGHIFAVVPHDGARAAVHVHGGVAVMALENIGASLDVGADRAGRLAPLDDEHQDFAALALTDAGTGVDAAPVAVEAADHQFTVDDERRGELDRVGHVCLNGVGGVGDIHFVVARQFNALVARRGVVVRAVLLAVTHGIARDLAAGAAAVRVIEAAGGDAEQAVVVADDHVEILAVVADAGGRAAAQLRRILCHGEHADVARVTHTQKQDAVLRVDREHLLAHRGVNVRACVLDAGAVDIDVLPAVLQHGGVGIAVILKRGAAQLPEHGVERFLVRDAQRVGLLGRVGGIGRVGRVEIDRLAVLVHTRLDRRAFALVPGLRHLLVVHPRLHLVDHVGREDRLREPLVRHRAQSGFNVFLAEIPYDGNIREDNEAIAAFQEQNYGQKNREKTQKPVLFLLFLRLLLRGIRRFALFRQGLHLLWYFQIGTHYYSISEMACKY